MELRGCSHLHYIQAIKEGSIVKTMNVGWRGNPTLVFKSVKDIYEAENSKSPDSLPASLPKDEFRGAFFGCDRVKIESSSSSVDEGSPIKTESKTCEISCNAGDDQEGGDSDDLSCDKMTLNQLKDMASREIEPGNCEINCNDGDDQRDSDSDDPRCDKMTLNQLKGMVRRKKRKFSRMVDLAKLNGKSSSPIKKENPNLISIEDDIDLELPISCLKSKPSKKKKLPINKCVSSSSQSTTAISVKSEEISSEGLLYFSEHPSAPINVKIEIFETDNSYCQSVVCRADSVGFDKEVSAIVSNNEKLETDDECVIENGELFSSTDQRHYVVNEVSFDDLEHAEIGSLPDETSISMETTEVVDPEINSHQSLVLPLSETNEQEDISHPPSHDTSQAILFHTEDHNSSVHDSSQCNSIPHEILQQEKGSSNEVQQADIGGNSSLQCVGTSEKGGVCVFRNDEDEFSCKLNTEVGSSPMSNNSSPSKFNSFLNPDNFLARVNDDAPTVDEAQSLIYAGGHPTRKGSAEILFGETSNELSTSNLADNCHHPELQHPPERLFSNRKAISPTSQEKLCKAMDAIELLHDDIEQYKCREQLCFEKQTQNKASSELGGSEVDVTAEGPEQTIRTEVTVNCKKIRRPKNFSKGSHPKGILKVHQLSRSVPRVSTGCTSIQSCSQSAIAFTQRQMLDIEGLTTKLTTELNSMKDIVECALLSEASLSTSLQCNADEVKTAIGNAKKAEETAKKLLSMMARDCSRFCKIMRLTVNDNADFGNSIPKKTKKITFADEAGGKLCHVKVFEEDDMVSVIV